MLERNEAEKKHKKSSMAGSTKAASWKASGP
jgi:hypothetical protein